MGQNENGLDAHQRSHTNGRTQEVSKYQEGAAEGNKAPMQSQAVQHGAHCMLAHAKVNIAALVVQLGEIAASLHHGLVRGA